MTRSGEEPGRVRDVDLLEVAETVQPALGPLDHRVVVGVAFADVELAANDVVARARVADDVDPLDVDLRTVVDGEAAARSCGSPCRGRHAGELRRRRSPWRATSRLMASTVLSTAAGVVDVARAQSGEPQQRRPVDLAGMRSHGHARDVVLRPLVDRDRDDVAGWVRLVGDVGVGDAEVGVAVLHVIPADRLLVGGEAIGIVDVGALEPRQEVHRARLHQVVQAVARDGVVADEADLADAGLLALVDGEDEIDAAVRQVAPAAWSPGPRCSRIFL